jgi:hypothetical protein
VAKHDETQYLDFAAGWLHAERPYSIAKAMYTQVPGRTWKEWYVSSMHNCSERKYQHALNIHGKDPGSAIRPPKQIAWIPDSEDHK